MQGRPEPGTSEGHAPVTAPHASPRLTHDAFAERFEGAARVLWTIAAAVLGHRAQVEDVIQEAAIVGLEKLDQFDPNTHFEAWMGRIVRFVALNHLRREARRRTSQPELLESVPAVEPLDHDLDDTLQAALAGLRPVVRACLLLKVVEELEYREIAQVLEIPEGTAMSHVHRARHALQSQLSQEVMG